jgi:release factor glutamine methyltransferase
MIIKDLIQISRTGVESRLDGVLAIEVLLAYCLNFTKEQLFMSLNEIVNSEVRNKFCILLERYMDGEPVSQLVNNKEFYGLDFYVDKRVLTPRPETELLVDKVIDYCNGRGKLKIIDVGTGSGCIAVAISKSLPEVIVSGSDVSEEALEVAVVNAERHGVSDNVRFIQADLLEGIGGDYDVVVANLPYIGTENFNFVSSDVKRFEPNVALFGGDNGLRLYERLFNEMRLKKWKPKLLLGEFGFLQGEEMRLLLYKYFEKEKVFIINDHASIERVFMVYFE